MKSNFDFLKKEFPGLAKDGASAEKIRLDNSRLCMIAVGAMAEDIIRDIYEKDDNKHPEKSTQYERLKQLKKQKVIPNEIYTVFNAIRAQRNMAAHQRYYDVEAAENLLQSVHRICEWYIQKYGQESYELIAYIPLQDMALIAVPKGMHIDVDDEDIPASKDSDVTSTVSHGKTDAFNTIKIPNDVISAIPQATAETSSSKEENGQSPADLDMEAWKSIELLQIGFKQLIVTEISRLAAHYHVSAADQDNVLQAAVENISGVDEANRISKFAVHMNRHQKNISYVEAMPLRNVIGIIKDCWDDIFSEYFYHDPYVRWGYRFEACAVLRNPLAHGMSIREPEKKEINLYWEQIWEAISKNTDIF